MESHQTKDVYTTFVENASVTHELLHFRRCIPDHMNNYLGSEFSVIKVPVGYGARRSLTSEASAMSKSKTRRMYG